MQFHRDRNKQAQEIIFYKNLGKEMYPQTISNISPVVRDNFQKQL